MTSSSFFPCTPGQAAGALCVRPASLPDAAAAVAPRDNGLAPHPEAAAPDAPYDAHLAIELADWDVLFAAVTTTLRRIVGERLGELPEVPAHSAELSASLVQAVVLDCVSSLDRLHHALKQERSQRPTT
ncbi:MAG: hypothetical protein PSV26_20920 [Polaromonas sp.]|uniref:hypothetical protein n=1 Tax=Polaromonas sp. TaxID=1869339 RepID=UPI0024892845|nr:hypothetical protein [Polaromonas sp.]MDI1239952.1 hypothetical protein [Polaromonas sp.]